VEGVLALAGAQVTVQPSSAVVSLLRAAPSKSARAPAPSPLPVLAPLDVRLTFGSPAVAERWCALLQDAAGGRTSFVKALEVASQEPGPVLSMPPSAPHSVPPSAPSAPTTPSRQPQRSVAHTTPAAPSAPSMPASASAPAVVVAAVSSSHAAAAAAPRPQVEAADLSPASTTNTIRIVMSPSAKVAAEAMASVVGPSLPLPPPASLRGPLVVQHPWLDTNEFSKFHVNYAEEGRKLLATVNLEQPTSRRERWSGCDPIWRHPKSGAVLMIGDDFTAKSRKSLQRRGITRIVNCQDSDGQNYFEGDSGVQYLSFTVGLWRRSPEVLDGADGTWTFWAPYFDFIQESLNSGHNVLVHCLAGAHRAGTAGIAALMLFCGWDWVTATMAAKKLRPVIDAIGDFPELLQALDHRLHPGRPAVVAGADAGGGGSRGAGSPTGARLSPQELLSPAAPSFGGSPMTSPSHVRSAEERVQLALAYYAQLAGARQEVISAASAHLAAARPFEALIHLEKAGALE